MWGPVALPPTPTARSGRKAPDRYATGAHTGSKMEGEERGHA